MVPELEAPPKQISVTADDTVMAHCTTTALELNETRPQGSVSETPIWQLVGLTDMGAVKVTFCEVAFGEKVPPQLEVH